MRRNGAGWPEPRTSQEHRELEALRLIQALALDLPRPRRIRSFPARTTSGTSGTSESDPNEADRLGDSAVKREGSHRESERVVSDASKGQK
mmetsp:Transcript_64513/g.102631  ORF Transcript_64513/g.102631 Transcript_64513/m.102631 type:complete len:91 (+) Transcript_64513:106-378(+)